MAQAAQRRADYDEIIADPLFKLGYAHIFDDIEPVFDVNWADGEQEAYARGRQFGVVVKTAGEGYLPLMRGGLAHPRAKLLLMLAMRAGDVL